MVTKKGRIGGRLEEGSGYGCCYVPGRKGAVGPLAFLVVVGKSVFRS